MEFPYKLGSIFLIIFIACNNQKENLDYPKSIKQINEVVLSRPDELSNGKSAEQKKLNEQEINELLMAIENSKPIGLTKFYPDYFIIFSTKDGENKRLRINGNIIKGYKNDFSYEFILPKSLSEFRRI